MQAYCEHVAVVRQESRNPRMPYIVWRCFQCGKMFQPKGNLRLRWTAWREARRLRREMERWRNG